MNDMFGNPIHAEPTPLPDDFRLTPALRRTLEKARKEGAIRRSGIYALADETGAADKPQFDFQENVDRCIAAGWLTFGEAFNTYTLTSAGEQALIAHENGAAFRQERARLRRNEQARQRRAEKVAA